MKILIIKLSSLGDIVHALPCASALKKTLPNTKIDWLVYEKFAGILQGSNNINELKILKYKTISALIAKAVELKQENYDLIIDLQGLIKTAFLSSLIGAPSLGYQEPREWLAKIFYKYHANLGHILDNATHIVEKNLLMAQKALEILEPNYNAADKGLAFDFDHLRPPAVFLKQSNAKVCIIPSTTWETKFWANEYWIEVIKYIFEKQKSKIFLLGTESDLEKLAPLIRTLLNHGSIKILKNGSAVNPESNSNYILEIVSNKQLSELPGFFREMDTIIGVDTGPLHIAAAACFVNGVLKTKQDLISHRQVLPIQIIGLFGPSSGKRTGPYGFEYFSADEISGIKANQKRKLASKINMMRFIKPEMLIDRL